ncbi:MAG: hypothetical protein JO166_10695 [Deltaproteobacteria bacterium]|nr:hypothetical protein [Deltaproteobacteria bacterium]
MRLCRALIFSPAIALSIIGLAMAQAPSAASPKSQQQLDIAAAKAQRKAVVGQNMQLTAAQAEAFWPLYDAYEGQMDRIEDRHIREIKNYVESYNKLTNADANRKLDEVMAIQQARLNVQQQYIPKFRAALPGVAVTRFFQIDNKLRAMVQCNIAQMVPLAQPPPHSEHTSENNP